ncbi:hypothetical protein EOA27_15285 [Mesorhizobium sp. M2A.F.Ca.ET.037.01.1.1]|nr:hypothetical protein EOA27_15285 [Mesorhizobium sp. M2A.F.Ca.ET.037.01.1.1]
MRKHSGTSHPTALLPYCPTALLPYCPTALLPYCPTALLPYCPSSGIDLRLQRLHMDGRGR